MRISIPSGADLNTYTIPGSYVSLNSVVTQSLLNGPQNVKNGAYLDVYELSNGSYTQIMRQWRDGAYSVRSIRTSDGSTTDWVPYASATQPKEYNLPLSSGITGTAKYYKTQEGIVIIRGWLDGASNPANGAPVSLATLPVGYRPIATTRYILPNSAVAPSTGIVRIEVTPTGEIRLTAWNEVGSLESGVAVDMMFLAG